MADAARMVEKECGLKGSAVCAVRVKEDAATLAVLSHLTGKLGMDGVYISYEKPSQRHSASSEWGRIAEKLFIIDADCRRGMKNTAAAACLQSQTSLTELSVDITRLTHESKYKFVVLDSVTGMATFNGQDTTERFVRYMANKMRGLDMGCILIFPMDEKSDVLAKSLSTAVDRQVSLA